MGGNHNNAIKRSLDHADGWQPISFSAQELREKISYLNDYSDKIGRSLDNFNISLRNRIRITNKSKKDSGQPETALIGSKDEVIDKILSYENLKIKEIVLDFITPDKDEIIETMEIMGKELIPKL